MGVLSQNGNPSVLLLVRWSCDLNGSSFLIATEADFIVPLILLTVGTSIDENLFLRVELAAKILVIKLFITFHRYFSLLFI